MQPTPPLGQRLLPLVLFGLGVGLLRYALEFLAPLQAKYVGVYFLMPLALLVIGIRGTWGTIRWPALALTMLLMCLMVWGIPNTLAYTTAQFEGWTHGRFDPAHGAPIAETTFGKIATGLGQALGTSIGGTIWCTIVGTLVIWLPGRLRSRGAAPS